MTSPQRYKDKIILVTASATGIGLAMAHRFAKEGGTVIINSRNKERVDKAVESIKSKGFKAVGFPANVANKVDRENLIDFVKQTFNKLDVLVCNAAISIHLGSTLDTSEEQYDKMFNVNVKSVFFLIKGLYPLLKNTKESNILILASYVGFDPDTNIGVYSVTKTALIGLIKLLAKELNEEKIRVNGISPGLIKTKLSEPLWKGREDLIIENMKVNRLGVPEDISNAAAFLCSEEASYLTGEILVICGKSFPRL